MRLYFLFLLFCVSFGLQTDSLAAARTLAVWPRSLELQRAGEHHELLAAWEEAGVPKALATDILFVSDNPAVAVSLQTVTSQALKRPSTPCAIASLRLNALPMLLSKLLANAKRQAPKGV